MPAGKKMPEKQNARQNMEKKYMQQAIDMAKQNVKQGKGGPFGAVIVKNGNVVGTGVNRVTTQNDPTSHAEINAIRAAAQNLGTYDLAGCEIYSSCEPCPMCLGAIYWAHIDKLFFGAEKNDAATIDFSDAFIYHEIEKPHANRSITTKQIMRPQALEVFKLWEQSENKVSY